MFEKLAKRLEELGYSVACFEKKEQAAEYLNEKIDGTTVGFGGSVSAEEMGLYQSLSAHNEVFSHMKAEYLNGLSADEMRFRENSAAVYISSVNGIAETGEIINIDGTCNRVASTLFGHEKVYLIVGKNKLAPDYDGALWRARNVSAPKNAQRLKMKTPCAIKADKCYNCKSEARICKALVVFWEKPRGQKMEIVLVNEELGY